MAEMFVLIFCLSMISAMKVENEIEQLKDSLNTVLTELETNKKEIAELKTALDNCRCQHEELKEKRLLMPASTISTQPQVVAFSAWLDHDVTLGELQAIEYNQVRTNLGGAYDARHGHFTAPIRGVYIISATTLNYKNHETHLEIVKNGVHLAELYGDPGIYSQSSQTLVIELDANDMVWVRHYRVTSPVTAFGKNDRAHNTFSGVLVAEIN